MALKQVYAKQVVAAGPVFAHAVVEPGKLRLHFTEVGSGLVVHGAKLSGFAIAGADRKFVWATAVIEGGDVIVSNPTIALPLTVRYGWADSPVCGLYNREGLPAAPFRSDTTRQ